MRRYVLAASSLAVGLVLLVIYVAQAQTAAQFEQGIAVQARIAAVTPANILLDYADPSGKPLSAIGSEPLRPERLRSFEAGMIIEARHWRTIPTRVLPTSALADLRPSHWLLGAGATWLALALWLIDGPRRTRRRRAEQRDVLAVLQDALRQARTIQFWTGAVLLGFGSFVIWLLTDAQQRQEVRLGGMLVLYTLALISLGIGGFSWLRAWGLRRPAQSWVLTMLLEHPEEIAWIYVEHLSPTIPPSMVGPMWQELAWMYLERLPEHWRKPQSHAQVWLWFRSGRSYVLPSSPEDGPILLEAIKARAPHAHVGYDAAIEQAYRADPTRFGP